MLKKACGSSTVLQSTAGVEQRHWNETLRSFPLVGKRVNCTPLSVLIHTQVLCIILLLTGRGRGQNAQGFVCEPEGLELYSAAVLVAYAVKNNSVQREVHPRSSAMLLNVTFSLYVGRSRNAVMTVKLVERKGNSA